MKIAAGTVLILETGEYSDYTFNGPFRVLKEFDQEQLVEEFRAQWVAPLGGWKEEPDTDEFIGWLNSNGYVEPMENVSWHIGSYGNLDPVIQPSPEEIAAAKEFERAIKETYYREMSQSADESARTAKQWIKKGE